MVQLVEVRLGELHVERAAVVTDEMLAPEKTDRMGGVARFARKRDRNALSLR